MSGLIELCNACTARALADFPLTPPAIDAPLAFGARCEVCGEPATQRWSYTDADEARAREAGREAVQHFDVAPRQPPDPVFTQGLTYRVMPDGSLVSEDEAPPAPWDGSSTTVTRVDRSPGELQVDDAHTAAPATPPYRPNRHERRASGSNARRRERKRNRLEMWRRVKAARE